MLATFEKQIERECNEPNNTQLKKLKERSLLKRIDTMLWDKLQILTKIEEKLNGKHACHKYRNAHNQEGKQHVLMQ